MNIEEEEEEEKEVAYHPSYEQLSPLEEINDGIPIEQELLYKFEIVKLYKNIYLQGDLKNMTDVEEQELIRSQYTFRFMGDNNSMKKYYYNVQKTTNGIWSYILSKLRSGKKIYPLLIRNRKTPVPNKESLKDDNRKKAFLAWLNQILVETRDKKTQKRIRIMIPLFEKMMQPKSIRKTIMPKNLTKDQQQQLKVAKNELKEKIYQLDQTFSTRVMSRLEQEQSEKENEGDVEMSKIEEKKSNLREIMDNIVPPRLLRIASTEIGIAGVNRQQFLATFNNKERNEYDKERDTYYNMYENTKPSGTVVEENACELDSIIDRVRTGLKSYSVGASSTMKNAGKYGFATLILGISNAIPAKDRTRKEKDPTIAQKAFEQVKNTMEVDDENDDVIKWKLVKDLIMDDEHANKIKTLNDNFDYKNLPKDIGRNDIGFWFKIELPSIPHAVVVVVRNGKIFPIGGGYNNCQIAFGGEAGFHYGDFWLYSPDHLMDGDLRDQYANKQNIVGWGLYTKQIYNKLNDWADKIDKVASNKKWFRVKDKKYSTIANSSFLPFYNCAQFTKDVLQSESHTWNLLYSMPDDTAGRQDIDKFVEFLQTTNVKTPRIIKIKRREKTKQKIGDEIDIEQANKKRRREEEAAKAAKAKDDKRKKSGGSKLKKKKKRSRRKKKRKGKKKTKKNKK